MSIEEMKFDLSFVEIPIDISGTKYTLREASSDIASKYRKFIMDQKKSDGDGYKSGLADAEPLLVSMCLFDSEGKGVSVDTIKKWPERIQKALFFKARDMSSLNETGKSDEDADLKKLKESLGSGSA